MIYKPNTASPDMETVIPVISNDGGGKAVRFKCSGICSSKISMVRQKFKADDKAVNNNTSNDGFTYKYITGSEHISYVKDSYKFNVGWYIPEDTLFKKNVYTTWGARFYEEESFNEDDFDNEYPFNETDDKRYGTFNYTKAYNDASTKERVYNSDFYICTDYKPTSMIGYGTVQDFTDVYLMDKSILNYISGDKPKDSIVSDNFYVLKIFPHTFHNKNMGTDKLSKSYDSYYARYYIEINGIYYKILDWKYYFWGREVKNSVITQCEFNSETDTDGYDNPLAMYVLIRKHKNGSFSKDDQYTIYCNYIDTDDYTFKYIDEPIIDFYNSVKPESKMTFFKTQDEALINENIYTTKYSNINISAVYPQNGTYVSKYKVSLYQVSSNNKLTLINSTNYEFGQNICYEYDEFMNGKKYLLHFEITNSDGNILNYYRCISPSYGAETRLIRLNTSTNKKNNSVIVDYSNLFSIAPKERIHGDYEFITNGDDEPYLHLHNGNALTYDEIDGEDKLKIENPLTNIVIKLNSYFTGNICSTKDDDGNEYKLDWDGIKFIYTALNKKYTYYPYDKEESEWLDTMLENMKLSTINTDVPYIWSEDFSNSTFDSKLYIHTEEPASEYWWSIVMYNDGIYFKNLSIDNSEWVHINA